MSDALLVLLSAALALTATIAYAVLAGADFGGGVWDALARGERAAEERQAVAHAMGPVWEANHVWLIFLLVVLFTAFPAAYASLSVLLFVPFHIVLVGIILRGGAFVFRSHAPGEGALGRVLGGAFGMASIATPFVLGACLGAVSSGRSWTSPFALLVGALAVAICAYLAATYLTLETTAQVQASFRRKALASGAAVTAFAVVLLPVASASAPHLVERLSTGGGAFILALAAAAAGGSAASLYARRFHLARVLGILLVVLVLLGWGLAEMPYLVYPTLTLAAAAAPRATLLFVVVSTPIGAAVLVPALVFLFSVFKGEAAGGKGVSTPPSAPPAGPAGSR